MTTQKSFKRQIRSRMEKTSESYTAARRVLIAKAAAAGHADLAGNEAPPGVEATAAGSPTGVSPDRPADEAVISKTGRSWEDWFALLDAWNGTSRPHAEIARWLVTEHDVPGWWAQSITVTYERARGLRLAGQGRDGKYSVSASRTVNVPVEVLYQAFADTAVRNRWLPDAPLEVTTATKPKSVRGRWTTDGSRLVAGFDTKGESKSLVGVAHEKLPDADAARAAKQFWVARLTDLKNLLEA